MVHRILLLLLLLLLVGEVCYATNEGMVRGKAIDKGTGKPIVGANIYVTLDKKKTKIGAISQTDGTFILPNLPEGTWTITCESPLYITQRIVGVAIKGDHTFLAYFRMNLGDPIKNPAEEILTYAALQAQMEAKTKVATETETSIFDAPATVYIVSKEQIQQRGYMSLEEVLEDIPEITVHLRADPQYSDLIASRGLFGNEKFLIMQNGTRINSLCSNPEAIEKNYNVQTAERIEILIGSASALYGTDAFLGVINIITAKGNQLNSTTINTSYGSFNTNNSSIAVGYGNKKMSFSATGGIYASKEAYMPKFYPSDFAWYNQQYLQDSQMLVSPFDSATQTVSHLDPWGSQRMGYSYSLRFNIGKFEIGHNRTEELHPTSWGARPSMSIYAPDDRWHQSNSTLYVQHVLSDHKNNKWELKSLLNSSIGQLHKDTRFENVFSQYRDAYKYARDYNLQLTETFHYRFNKQHQLTTGFNGVYTNALPITSDLSAPYGSVPIQYYAGTQTDANGDPILDKDGYPIAIPQLYFHTQRAVLGVFAQYQGQLTPKLSLLLGARVDAWLSSFKDTRNLTDYDQRATFNPRLGLVYRATSELGIKLFYGESFSMPAPNDAFRHFGTAFPVYDSLGHFQEFQSYFFHLPNFKLKAQKVRTLELSTIFAKGNFLATASAYTTLGTNLYENYTRNTAQDFRGITVFNTEQSQATGSHFVIGSHLRVEYKIGLGANLNTELRAYASWVWTKAWEPDLAHFTLDAAYYHQHYTPTHSLKAGINFRHKGFSIDARLIYRSSVNSESQGLVVYTAPAAAIVNANVRYVILDASQKRLGLALFVKARNLFNTRYYTPTNNNVSYFGLSPQDPISIQGGVNFTF